MKSSIGYTSMHKGHCINKTKIGSFRKADCICEEFTEIDLEAREKNAKKKIFNMLNRIARDIERYSAFLDDNEI